MGRWAKLSENNVIEQIIIDDGYMAEKLDGLWVEMPADIPNVTGWTLMDNGTVRPAHPFPSWSWDDSEGAWVAPVPMPETYNDAGRRETYDWDEAKAVWVKL